MRLKRRYAPRFRKFDTLILKSIDMTAMKFDGEIIRGSQRAAALGFPTINIASVTALTGIYAAKAVIEGREYEAAAYADQSRGVLEAHCFGLDTDVYGKHASITLEHKVRDSRQFSSDTDLKG